MNYRNKISLCNQKLKIYVSFKIKNNISLTTHFLKDPSSSRHFRIFIQITCRKTRIFMQNPIVLCIYLPRQFQESNAVSQKITLAICENPPDKVFKSSKGIFFLQNIRLFFLFGVFFRTPIQHMAFYHSIHYADFSLLRSPFSSTAVLSSAYFAVSRTENSKMTF